jgi:aerobic-type carbon monoxide dehydrogenase small subunit (CoxS/CutS family)
VVDVKLHVNGEERTVEVTPVTSLLAAVRQAGLTGTQGACEEGECGSCSVLLDDELVCACLVPALTCDGARVTTVEGLVAPDLAAALAAHGAVQCGFCTPGFVVAALALLDGDEPLDHATVADGLAGNLCRCTGYQPILAAVLEVDRARRA